MHDQIEWVAISELKENPKNPNKHSKEQIERLAEIIKYQGWRHPIVVSNRSGYIAAGHGRLAAARVLKQATVPVSRQDFLDEDQEFAFLTSDNAIALWAELDLGFINSEIPNLSPEFDINMLGIDGFEIEPADKYADKDLDETPAVRETSIKLGDLFSLGGHRLLCGDSTDKDQVSRLMNGEKADMVFTDPPYGMNLDTKYASSMGKSSHNFRPVIEDDIEFDPSHILEIFKDCKEIFLWGADYYCWFLPRNGSWVVWDKRSHGEEHIGVLDGSFGADFEMCWSKNKHQRGICRVIRNKGAFIKSRDNEDTMHPTQKPIQLTEWFFERWGKDAKLIWDGYLGSGSTLIACEKTNRKCYGMEIDQQYCQVIIDRWEKFTGQKAVKV